MSQYQKPYIPFDRVPVKDRAKLLSNLFATNSPCFSSRNNGIFVEKEKLDNIARLLADTTYHRISRPSFELYQCKSLRKKELEGPIIVVTSHADMVPAITNPNCGYDAETGCIYGTLDNTATNAVCMSLMQDGNLPKNVLFAFTADEETGRCQGARDVLEYLKTECKVPKDMIFPIALDVTYEGYSSKKAFTLENCDIRPQEPNRLLGYCLQETKESFLFVPHTTNDRAYVTCLGMEDCISPNHSWYDEAGYYSKLDYPTASVCFPVYGGDMHCNKGVFSDIERLFQYKEALSQLLQAYSLDLTKEQSNYDISDALIYVETEIPFSEEPEEDFFVDNIYE